MPDAYLHCSDEELLLSFRKGKRAAFETLVRRYERELYGYLRRYLDDAHLADDVFQNTFLQVFSKAHQYEKGRPVRPWLYTIATNAAVDAMRRQGRHTAVSLDQTVSESQDAEVHSLLDMLESSASEPLEHVQAQERRQLVRDAVNQLPEFLRQVVILAYYQGLKHRDISQIMKIPVGTVKSRLHAAMARLHEAWTTEPATPED